MGRLACGDCGKLFLSELGLFSHSRAKKHNLGTQYAKPSPFRVIRERKFRSRIEAARLAPQARFWPALRTAEQMDDHRRPVDMQAVRELYPWAA